MPVRETAVSNEHVGGSWMVLAVLSIALAGWLLFLFWLWCVTLD